MRRRPGRGPDAPPVQPPLTASRAARRTLGVVRSAGRAVHRSRVGFLVGPLAQQGRTRMAPAADVLAVLDAFSRADVRGWLAGGWGVDALLGLQTRRHADIDVLLHWEDGVEERARRALAALGFRPLQDQVITDGRPLSVRWVVDDGLVAVDMLPVDLNRWPFVGLLNGRAQAAGAAGAGPADPLLDDSGVIAGHRVPCVPLRLQLVLHQGYPMRKSDLHDFALLEELFVRRRSSP